MDELQNPCVALLFEDVMSPTIKQSTWCDSIAQFFFFFWVVTNVTVFATLKFK